MDVTAKNFRTILNEFDDVIDKASFFSIDAEFTGLNNERTCPFNTPSELYKKICSGTDEYIIVQLGITAFRQCTDNADDLIYRSYNFYVYPQGRDQTFRCSGPSMQFLAEQNFDFNKLFRYGISCCTQETANQLRKQLEEKQRYREDLADGNETANVDEVPVPAEELANLDEIRTQIKDFLKSDDKKNIIIGKCNAFQRKLIYQMIDKEFAKDVTATSLQKDNAKVISVERKLSIEEQKKLLDKKNEEEDDELHRLIGLSALVQKISDSKKLIVGHNMFLDLFYLIRQFFEPVPDSLKEFKKRAHKIFPNILDTKHLCSEKFREQIPSSVLKHVYEAVLKEPFKLPRIRADSAEYEYTEIKEHEAGYDSYMTGVCFIALSLELHVKSDELNSKSHHLRNFLNKIFVMRLSDIFYINLTGNELVPKRDHVFHVRFPDNWKQSDLIHHFRKYGSIFIRWINNNSAFVSLNNRENASILLQTIGRTPNVKIVSFETHQKTQRKLEELKTDVAVKRKTGTTAAAAASTTKDDSDPKKAKRDTPEPDKLFVEDCEWPEPEQQ